MLREYSDRKATPEEERELMDWLAEYEDDGSFHIYIQELLNDYPSEKKVEGVDWERIYSEILSKRNIAPASELESSPEEGRNTIIAHRVHFLKTSWFRYAAAVLLIVGGIAIWYELFKRSDLNSSNLSGSAEIGPGKDRAVLTLADGTKIILDNAANGNVAQQGGTKIIKLDNGQLAYSPLQKGHGGLSGGRELLYNTIGTPRGGQYQITLPDRTRVWLNAASSIKFPAVFSGATREVEVTGEAYMEVARNSKQPFKVKANGTEIQVLGTSFNINAYPDEEVIKTTLVEGSVKVVEGQQKVILKPGQQAQGAGGSIKVSVAHMDEVMAWKNGIFNFSDASIKTVMRQISRWYDVEVQYGQDIPSKKFSGEIQRDLNLSEVLDVLNDAGINLELEGRKIIVHP